MKFSKLAAIAALGFASSFATATVVYQTGSSDPWGTTANDTAMNGAFGAGAWTKFQGFNIAGFSGASFVFLDGSDGNSIQLQNFLLGNGALIDSFVSRGGRLFINDAPNVGGSFSLGFGVNLSFNASYNTASTNAHVTPAGIAAGLLAGGITDTYTGNWFSHASVSGANLSNLVEGDKGTIFGAMQYGDGFVAFGGQTTANFHYPNTDAQRLLINELSYVNTAAVQTNRVPEPATIALLGMGLLGLAATKRRE